MAPLAPPHDTIFTMVSRPGPAEQALLDRARGVAASRRRVCRSVALQCLESPQRPAKASILMVHGRGHAGTIFTPLALALAPTRRVVCPDLPGFGHSGIAPLAGTSREDALACFRDPIEALAQEEGPVVLVGHSLGGLVALDIALRARCDVRALVLIAPLGLSPYVAPVARAYLHAGPERVSRVARALGLRVGLTRFTPPAGEAPDEDTPRLLALRDELGAGGPRDEAKRAFDALVPLLGDAISRQHRLGEVDLPVLLVWGERDEAFPLPIAMDAVTRFPRAELEVLPQGHSPHVEAPARTLELVTRFLKSHEGEIDRGLFEPESGAPDSGANASGA